MGSGGDSGETTIQISRRSASTIVPFVTTAPGCAGSGNGSTRQIWGLTPHGSEPNPCNRFRARRADAATHVAAAAPAVSGR